MAQLLRGDRGAEGVLLQAVAAVEGDARRDELHGALLAQVD